MSKIKDGYKLELQTPKTMKLFRSTNKLIAKIKNGEKVPRLEVVEIVLDQCNLVDNNHIQSLKYHTLVLLLNLILIC